MLGPIQTLNHPCDWTTCSDDIKSQVERMKYRWAVSVGKYIVCMHSAYIHKLISRSVVNTITSAWVLGTSFKFNINL